MARNGSNDNKNFGYDENFDYDVNDVGGRGSQKAKSSEHKTEKPKEERERKPRDPSSVGVQITTALLFVVALFLLLCLIFSVSSNGQVVGSAGVFIGKALLGFIGGTAILIPFIIAGAALRFKRDYQKGRILWGIIFSILSLLFMSIIVHTFFCVFGSSSELVVSNGKGQYFNGYEFFAGINRLYSSGQSFVGGGVAGGFFAVALMAVIGKAGTIIFSLVFLAFCLLFVFGTTPADVWSRVKFYIIRQSERRAANKKTTVRNANGAPSGNEHIYYTTGHFGTSGEKKVVDGVKRGGDASDDAYYDTTADQPAADEEEKRKRKIDNIDVFNMSDTKELVVYNETIRPEKTSDGTLKTVFNKPDDETIRTSYVDDEPADDILNDTNASMDFPSSKPDKGLEVKRTQTVAPSEAPKKPKKPSYIFPPIDLLQYHRQAEDENAEQELRTNARKLVETLASFNIHTKIVNISRGPAVTRYEIAPEVGTKVSAIINRADDISLGLSSLVIIEGVIPGKGAIGIEVPNKNVSMVYLRELIEDRQFKDAKSKLTASLGIDLTGTKIYVDIAKMPHLLIAGATGTGKSVCMNSLIISLLYKATPEEVKFILIDPKKVEFNMYDGIPHLLVPVVSDPKKAAGALNWCVTEMERRYTILETTNKRNLAQYNEAFADDPSAEKLPQIVIIIDELADLMLTARDVVETSINRIAAKARAAGIHLIIGTQRPSVDIITGTIKSNIPSRIACTVKSQIDSRTILDEAGAEKLVGRGDMLYAPVGSRVPMRVQGAFVDEKEIENIIGFIKNSSGGYQYDRDVADQIDKAAEMCGKKGKTTSSSSDSDDELEDDPMLDEAIKLAIEEKKISTSLIQRKLQLGYGRAAKLIDIMEARGVVSEPNGQKPRDVLITYDDYLEMTMRSGE
ncbi:MAG: DUF87 domain-containing protein [Clostridia bacterium]|nr:DUF87 domain-containing protein [Clostridia bacterium]